MRFQRFLGWGLLIVLGMGALYPLQIARAEEARPAPAGQASAYELILAMNTLRVSYGLPPLVEDPIINAVDQSTAATMAGCKRTRHGRDSRHDVKNVRGQAGVDPGCSR